MDRRINAESVTAVKADRDFKSELSRVAKMAKSRLDLLTNKKTPEFFLPDAIPFTKTVAGKFHEMHGFSFSITFLLAYHGIEDKGVIYFLDGFNEFWSSRGFDVVRDKLLLYCMYGFNEQFSKEDFVRKYPKIIRKYLKFKDPIAAFQADVYEFNRKICEELSSKSNGIYRPTGVFGLDYSFIVDANQDNRPSVGRLDLISRKEMVWI
jgi:hypothetical protein